MHKEMGLFVYLRKVTGIFTTERCTCPSLSHGLQDNTPLLLCHDMQLSVTKNRVARSPTSWKFGSDAVASTPLGAL